MKILIATNHSYMLWRFRKELIERLCLDFEVMLSMPFVGHEDDFQALGVKCVNTEIDRRGINPFNDADLIKRYKRLLDGERPDAVVTYSIKPNIYLGSLCRKRGICYFANVQGLGTAFERPILSTVVSTMYRRSLKKASAVFFENSQNADFFVRKKIIPSSRATVLSGAGINLDEYPYVPPTESTTCRFLYLGRIMKEKGVDEFFAAAKLLKTELGDKVSFDLVGFYEDSYRETVEKLIEEKIITFHGFRTDPKPYYAACDAVVMPSWHEGMSNVLLEGAAVGRALITSDIPGCREAVDDGVSGILCPTHDVVSLTDAMRKFANMTPAERTEMGRLGRELVEKHFDRRDVVKQTTTIVKNGIGG